MDDFARLGPEDRAAVFAISAAARGLLPAILEKDFWVCWTLKRLFQLPAPPRLIFKGGTSLSKGFHAIGRFSEDVDLAFDRADLGFGGNRDPLVASNPRTRVDRLRRVCRSFIAEVFLPRLTAAFGSALGPAMDEQWSLTLAAHAPDQLSVLFRYPPSALPAGMPTYIAPAVLLEFGARSDHSPAQDVLITPYAAADVPQAFMEPTCMVRVLAPERTFWEKATALHIWAHDELTTFTGRISRHYADVALLAQQEWGQRALANLDLLAEVVRHKRIFFASPRGRLDLAVPGTFRLLPHPSRLLELRRDYAAMRDMFFTEPVSFEELAAQLQRLEDQINGLRPD